MGFYNYGGFNTRRYTLVHGFCFKLFPIGCIGLNPLYKFLLHGSLRDQDTASVIVDTSSKWPSSEVLVVGENRHAMLGNYNRPARVLQATQQVCLVKLSLYTAVG